MTRNKLLTENGLAFYMQIAYNYMQKIYKDMKTLFTKNQNLILQLFFTNPEQKYYIQELGRILKKKPGVFQRDLYSLEKKGVLTSEYQGGARYFQVNKKYPLYQEIKNIIFKTSGVEGSLKNELKKHPYIRTAFIFGSFAHGKEDKDSDIDLMIVGRVGEEKLLKTVKSLENDLQREINYHIYSWVDWQKKIKQKNSFILNLIKQPKIFLIGDKNDL